MRFAPPLPRSAKRMLNHARLLTSIASARGLFDGEPRLSPTDLGAWIALSELWPGVAREVEREPQCLERLQKLTENREQFAAAVREWAEGGITALYDLYDLLIAAPGLGRPRRVLCISNRTIAMP